MDFGTPNLPPTHYDLMNELKGVRNKKARKSYDLRAFDFACFCSGGEGGIRTPGGMTLNSFQDCRNRPLCHFSAAKITKKLNSNRLLKKL
jgi:hypothetical protein